MAVDPVAAFLVVAADIPSEVAEHGVAFLVVVAAASGVAEPGVAALSGVADLSEVAALSEIAEPGVVSVALVSVADVVEPQASVHIAVAFAALIPVSVVAVVVDSPGCPRFFAFPNSGYYSSSSSSVEVVDEESVHSPTGARTNYGFCSVLSNQGLHQNKNVEHCHNNPTPAYNNVSDTNGLPINATTSHSRKTCPHLCQEQRRHRSYQASLLLQEVPEIRWVVAGKCQYLYLPLLLLE